MPDPSNRTFAVLPKLKSRLRELRSALWVRPTLFSLAGIAVILLVSVLDGWVGLPPVEVIEADSVRDLLRFTAGSTLTITTVSLSVLMLVLSLAAGQASPRAVPEIMADPVTQNAIGTFLGTFVFALAGLAFLEFKAVEGIGVTAVFGVALLLVAWSVKYLVQWIHHIADTLKLNRIIERIHDQAVTALEDYLTKRTENGGTGRRRPGPAGHRVLSAKAGHVQLVDVDQLDALAESHDLHLELAVREGDFVHPALDLMAVCAPRGVDDKLHASLQGSVVVAAERSASGDPLLGFSLLTEIVCRAMSPGINDPQSAIIATGYIGALLARAGAVAPQDYPPTRSESGRVTLKTVDFAAMLSGAIRPVVREGAGCAEVILAVVGTLADLADRIDRQYLPDVQAEAEAALVYGSNRLMLDRDKELLKSRVEALNATVRSRRG